MADKKISQFPTFDGTAGSEVFFVVASGDADNPNSSNYRYPFNNLTTDITKEGSAWTTGTDSIYTLTGAVGLGTSAPIYQLDVANTGRFRSDLIVSGDLSVSGTTHVLTVLSDGNVGIGTNTPTGPLEISSVSGGVIMPRMTTAQMNAITSPSNGEMIYNTSSGKFAGYAAGAWIPLH